MVEKGLILGFAKLNISLLFSYKLFKLIYKYTYLSYQRMNFIKEIKSNWNRVIHADLDEA